jgi:hypothetical protein
MTMKPNFIYDKTEYKLIDKDRGIVLIWLESGREHSTFRLVAPQGEVGFVVERRTNLGTPYWTIYNTLATEHFLNDDNRTPANALIEETMKVWGCTPDDEDLSDEARWAKTLVKFYKPLSMSDATTNAKTTLASINALASLRAFVRLPKK